MVKVAPYFGGRYLVSEDGTVSIAETGRVVACNKLPNGYMTLMLCAADGTGRTKRMLQHKLVAECFIGPRPEGMQINHKNCDKTDNRVENLEYISRQQNVRHAVSSGRYVNVGQNSPRSELARMTAGEIRELRSKHTVYELAKMFQMHPASVSNACNRRLRAG